ncbi:hypothetical protein [Bergeyella sp. RCAD1439]|uniref:hypothetical protein n=1 Tax=Bergeyella anatis TaxID=3113737 RepID=UPI002E17FA0C|nr:hypothetical protein [Bergeyella sp. RCAD1439]
MKIIVLLLVISLLSICSCKENGKKSVTDSTQNQIDFFDKKYFTEYSLVVDESTLADHPIQTFLDCNDGYFTIHYIPKSPELRVFWSEDYLNTYDIDKLDFEKESIKIEKKIKSNLNDYAIFCYYVPSRFLRTNSICSEESVYLDDETNAKIYYYNSQDKKWEQISDEKSNVLPKIFDSKYFTNKFPNYFTSENITQNKPIPSQKGQGYQILFEKTADINQDEKMDKILVYGTEWNSQPPEPSDFKKYKIVIHLSNDDSFRTLTNSNIIEPYYPNNVASGFSDIKVKDNYFTIEQANGGGGNIVKSFTTFKYNKQKNEIYLYKYSTITIQQSSGDEETSELTIKNFGIIPFESFNIGNLN